MNSTENEIRIIIADDHPIVRKGLRESIETDSRFKILAEADDGEAAIRLIEELKPDIAILDVDMPKMDGFQVAREINRKGLATKFVFLTIHSEEDLFHAAMDLGASGYILKDSALFEIARGIEAAASNQFYVSTPLTSFLIQRRQDAQKIAAEKPQLSRLTDAERRILQMISDYKSNKEIAAELFIHFRTVENHRNNICQKLDLRGRNALLKFALENKNAL